MGLCIRFHSERTKFKTINYFGEPVFNLSVAAKIRHNTATFRCIKEIQDKAIFAGLDVQVPPQIQAHIPFVNPIFRMKGNIPQKKEQDMLFDILADRVRNVAPKSLMFPSQIPRFNEIFVRQQDVKLVASRSDKIFRAQSDLERGIQQLLDERFDFPLGLPHVDGRLFITILRFREGFSEANYAKLMRILRNASKKFENNALEIPISPDDIKAVQFNGLFDRWVKEA